MLHPIYYIEDDHFYFVWKPAGLPTSFGDRHSFLDEIVAQKPVFFSALQEEFSQAEEYGLLNRLDNDTAGFVYFAKSPSVKETYLQQQDNRQLIKQYICVVTGKIDLEKTQEKVQHTAVINRLPDISIQNLLDELLQKYPTFDEQVKSLFDIHDPVVSVPNVDKISTPHATIADYVIHGNSNSVLFSVDIPIMHSASSADRMVAVLSEKDLALGRGKQHLVKTILQPLLYDETTNRTYCSVYIQQGIRHQIRVHLAKIGYPIVGDLLYRGDSADLLHLWSVGFGYPK